MRFCLYDVASGGTPLWCEPATLGAWQPVTITNGVFSILLGDEGKTNEIPPTVFGGASSDRWLGVRIFPDTEEMYPRRKVVSVGYAYRAEDANNADTVDGLHASSVPTSTTLFPLDASSKFTNTVLYTGHGNGLDADTVDGKHASQIGIPSGLIGMFDTACPSGWTRFAALDDKFPMGGTTYGATGGNTTHDHGGATASHTLTIVEIPAHQHGVSIRNAGGGDPLVGPGGGSGWIGDQNKGPAGSGQAHSHDIQAANHLPPYRTVLFCRKD